MGEPRIDAPRTVDRLAWWVQHGEEQRQEIELLRIEIQHLAAVVLYLADKLHVPLAEDAQDIIEIARQIVVEATAHIDGQEFRGGGSDRPCVPPRATDRERGISPTPSDALNDGSPLGGSDG